MFRTLAPYLAYAYITWVGWTTRIVIYGNEHRLALRRVNRRFIYTFWHNRQLFFTYSHRNEGVSIMVSQSGDGDMVAKLMELSRIEASRGSSTRGATAGLRDMMRVLARGMDLGITPDGPKGPAEAVKLGVLFLAQKLDVSILPLANALSRKLVMKSWDKYQVPLPFGRAVIRYGAPIEVGPGADLKTKVRELEATLCAVTAQAEQEVGN